MAPTDSSSKPIPDGITREHVLEAIADYERDGRPRGFGRAGQVTQGTRQRRAAEHRE